MEFSPFMHNFEYLKTPKYYMATLLILVPGIVNKVKNFHEIKSCLLTAQRVPPTIV